MPVSLLVRLFHDEERFGSLERWIFDFMEFNKAAISFAIEAAIAGSLSNTSMRTDMNSVRENEMLS